MKILDHKFFVSYNQLGKDVLQEVFLFLQDLLKRFVEMLLWVICVYTLNLNCGVI